jgi:hypothetical protein
VRQNTASGGSYVESGRHADAGTTLALLPGATENRTSATPGPATPPIAPCAVCRPGRLYLWAHSRNSGVRKRAQARAQPVFGSRLGAARATRPSLGFASLRGRLGRRPCNCPCRTLRSWRVRQARAASRKRAKLMKAAAC